MSWRRVNGNRKCMICGKPDWCSYTDDGAHRCMRVDGCEGFKVIKRCDDGGIIYRLHGDVPPPVYRRPKPEPKEEPRPEFGKIWARCYKKCTYDMAEHLAKKLGLNKGSTLSLMGLGWHPEQEVWVFPMYACDMETVLGLRTRDLRGNKKAILGSQQGLFGMPTSLECAPFCLPIAPPTPVPSHSLAVLLSALSVGVACARIPFGCRQRTVRARQWPLTRCAARSPAARSVRTRRRRQPWRRTCR